MAFSKEVLRVKKEECSHRCNLLDVEVDVLEGHHCMPQCRGGSNNPHNCMMLAGYNACSVYGQPVEDVHEKYDRLAIDSGLFLHPDTKELVTADQMPSDCFKGPKEIIIRKIERSKEKKKKKHHKK